MQAYYKGTDKKFNRLSQSIPPLIHYHKPYIHYQKHHFQSFGTHRELTKLARSKN